MVKIEKRKCFLIVFTDPHLAYSPTTLNLFYKLKKNYDVKLLAPIQPNYFSDNVVTDDDISYFNWRVKRNILDLLKLLFFKIADLLIQPTEKTLSLRTLFNYKTTAIISNIKKTECEIIAVDTMALWCVQQVGKKAHFLSLEIHDNDKYFENTQFDTIKSVIIQSQERFNHLFPNRKPLSFIVQNAPKYKNFLPFYAERKKTDLLYCGSAVSGFGIITCLDFIKDYKEYTLTVKGALPKDTAKVIEEFYSDLIEEKRLIIAGDYLSESDLTDYVSKFRIGFAFYDFYRFDHLRTFNYYTAPSGKIFQYLNSGIPIIANVLPAFEFINKQGCGKLIDYLSSVQIKLAIEYIENDYLKMAEKAKSVSSQFDFDKMIQPFLDFIETDATA